MERDGYIVIGIKIDDKHFSALTKVSLNQNFLKVSFKNPTISLINCWDQVNSWKNLWKFWNGPLCRNKSGTSSLFNVAAYWNRSNAEACGKKLPQILVNNIDNEVRRFGLRIYVRYSRNKFLMEILFWKTYHTYTLFCYIRTPLQTFPVICPNFQRLLAR